MKSESPRLVDRLRREGAWLGASWLPRLGDEGFVFAATFGEGTLRLSAIGGKVEASEGFLQAARREYREETGNAPPSLEPIHEATLLGAELMPDEQTEDACVVIRKRPDVDLADPPPLWISVFLGRITEEPRPVEKLPVFIVLPPAAFEAFGDGVVDPRTWRLIGDPRAVGIERYELRDTPKALAETPGLLARLWHRCDA